MRVSNFYLLSFFLFLLSFFFCLSVPQVDDSFNTWLIEINSSPACDYSTAVSDAETWYHSIACD